MKRKTEAQREMREHLDNIKALEDENGNTLNSLFMTQNDQRQYPELMKAMKKPISIQNIEQKLMDGRYKTLKKFMKDLNSLINAVKLSFQEDDAIHKEALILEDYVNSIQQENDDDSDWIEEDVKQAIKKRPKVEFYNSFRDYKCLSFVHAGEDEIIYRIHKIFSQDGKSFYFLGIRYFTAKEIPSSCLRGSNHDHQVYFSHYYKIIDFDKVLCECVVLSAIDFCSGAPVNMPLENVYYCENEFNHEKMEIFPCRSISDAVSLNLDLVEHSLILPKNPYSQKTSFSYFEEYSCTFDASCTKKFIDKQQLADHFMDHLPQQEFLNQDESYPIDFNPVIPDCPLQIPQRVMDSVDCRNGEILWFSSPPLKIVKKRKLNLSKVYQDFKAK